MKNTRKGFTLVELLAVIVILAIIMIIAIPAVLNTMNTAQQKTFAEYVTKIHNQTQTFVVAQKSANAFSPEKTGSSTNYSCSYMSIDKIGISSVGDYVGGVVVCEKKQSDGALNDTKILINLANNSYKTNGWINYTDNGEPKPTELQSSNKTDAANLKTSLAGNVTLSVGGESVTVKNPTGA